MAPVAAPADAAVDLDATLGWSLRTLEQTSTRIADLAVQAIELDERAEALPRETAELERRERELVDERARLSVQARSLELREGLVENTRRELAEQAAELEAKAAELEQRAQRLRWRWLLRVWRWRPPLPGRSARICELLFVPSPDGYKLLEQTGVALQPEATISGLLGEERSFVVTKIAQWPLDHRWCAYLEQI